jgi:predicted transposase/invertase (TIGR01784 family)
MKTKDEKINYGKSKENPLACFYEIFEEQAIEKGVEKGRQEGIQEGMQKGRQEGERLLKAKLAVTLLKEKHTPEQVCQWLGLSVQELNELMNG